MNPVQFINHFGNCYELEAALVKDTIVAYLTYKKDNYSKRFKGIYTNQNLPGNVMKSYQNIFEVFQLFSSETNFKAQPYLGQLIVKTKNMGNQNQLESMLQLQEVIQGRKHKIENDFMVDFYGLKNQVEVLKQKINFLLPVDEVKVKNMETPNGNQEQRLKQLQKKMFLKEKQISQICKGLNIPRQNFQVKSYGEGMEKPLGLEFSNEIRIFEDEMLKWKENFDKRIGQYSWQVPFKSPAFNIDGIYKGKGENGKPDGIGVFSYNKGTCIISAEWRQGLEDGRLIYFVKKFYTFYCQMRNGKIHGRSVYIYKDGRREEAEYENGKKHGRYRLLKDGKAKEEYTYVYGNYHGKYRTFRDNGQVQEEGVYENGIKTKYVNY